MPCGSHTAAHKLAQGSAAARAASNWRSSKASKQYGKACLKLILTRHGRGRVPPATALDICDCNPIEECAAPAPDVQDQPQQHLSPSGRHIVPPVEFTLFCARVAFPAYSIGSGSLIDGRIRRACSPFEAWAAWQLSRFAARCAICLKVAGPAPDKNCFVWQVPWCSTAATHLSRDLADHSSVLIRGVGQRRRAP